MDGGRHSDSSGSSNSSLPSPAPRRRTLLPQRSSFVVRRSSFVVRRSFGIHSSFVVRRSSFVVRHSRHFNPDIIRT